MLRYPKLQKEEILDGLAPSLIVTINSDLALIHRELHDSQLWESCDEESQLFMSRSLKWSFARLAPSLLMTIDGD
jgi:hypothetical protein